MKSDRGAKRLSNGNIIGFGLDISNLKISGLQNFTWRDADSIYVKNTLLAFNPDVGR